MENIKLNLNHTDDWKMYYKNSSREIVPIADNEINDLAKEKLDELKNHPNIPSKYAENWESVKLYNPKGNVDNAHAILIDPEDGAYDLNNSLNDLTGKEWTKFTKSWFVFNALHSDLKEEREFSDKLEQHPATFSPTMIAKFIEFFTKENQNVIDPFLGIGTTAVAASRVNRNGFGIELNPEFYELALERTPQFKNNIYNYDSTKLSDLNLPEMDFSISSPPYWDVLNRSTKDFKKNKESRGLQTNYSDFNNDLGNVSDYEEFLELTASVYIQLKDVMRSGSYVVIIVKNVKKQGTMYPLAWDLAKILSEHYQLKDEKIWIQDKIGLAPYGYPSTWASNILHHYCLIFRKN